MAFVLGDDTEADAPSLADDISGAVDNPGTKAMLRTRYPSLFSKVTAPTLSYPLPQHLVLTFVLLISPYSRSCSSFPPPLLPSPSSFPPPPPFHFSSESFDGEDQYSEGALRAREAKGV